MNDRCQSCYNEYYGTCEHEEDCMKNNMKHFIPSKKVGKMNSTIIDLFNLGMMRDYSDILPDKTGVILNLGPGNKHIDGAIELEYPSWDAECDEIPFDNNSVDQIHAYHFLEHIRNVPFLLNECNRVLKTGGHINIVVPYYKSSMQFQDLDHKTHYTENTWKVLFDTTYYSKGKVIGFDVHFNMIMGDSEKNLCLITQLVKK